MLICIISLFGRLCPSRDLTLLFQVVHDILLTRHLVILIEVKTTH